jgi:phosphoribosylformimino-5-aminoimidazole carboxamide ribotide isomerase
MLQRSPVAIPAVDLFDGRVVRLRQGSYQHVTDWSLDPLEVALAFARQGATLLHVIDLSAARDGRRPPEHARLIRLLVRESGLAVQVGGGARTAQDIDELLALGVARVLVGTLAARQPRVVGRLAADTARVAVAVDVRGDTVRAAGWLEDTGVPPARFVDELVVAGVRDFLITAIERDGTGAGPDVELLARLRPHVPGLLLAAGGIACAADVAAAAQAGAALYDGSLALPEASASLRSSRSDRPS